MTDYLALLNQRFPVRRSAEQKKAFAAALLKTARELGWEAHESDPGRGKSSRNLIIGNPDTARVLITAPYDTPAWSLFPPLRFPASPLLSLSYALLQALVTLALAFLLFRGLEALLPIPLQSAMLLLIGLYIGLMLLLNRTFPSRRTSNRSSAALAVMLTLMAQLPEASRQSAAFLLFDEGERGAKGAKTWGISHADIAWRTLTLRLDAVGVGRHMLLSCQRAAAALPEWEALQRSLVSGEGFTAGRPGRLAWLFQPERRQLPLSATLTACKGWYIPLWQAADQKNVDWIASRLQRWIAALPSPASAEAEEAEEAEKEAP